MDGLVPGAYGEIFQDLGTGTRGWVPGDQHYHYHYHYDLTVFVLDTMALKDSNVVINNGTPKGEAHITDIAQCNACDGGKLSFLETRE